MKPAKTKRPQRRLVNKKPAFLAAFRATCNLTLSAARVGIDRSLHYVWLREDPAYKAAFEAALPEAAGLLEDDMVHLARVGHFEPLVWKGQFMYAKRKRVMCKLADGTAGFLDELPKKHPKIIERRTVVTADGEQLGTYRRDAGLLAKLASAWMPEKYGAKLAVETAVEVTNPDDAKRALFLKLTGLCIPPAAPDGNTGS